MRHYPTPEDIQKMIDLRQKGLSIAQIVEKMGFSKSTVKRHLSLRGVERGG
ncbi:unnamed protein product [marine sediment metagenome]|uniref:Resolvase HTH domain-containing protein n=1 Tax=marine sediment metagenome TaxID=412755 RepID=X1T377_9ZZZZ